MTIKVGDKVRRKKEYLNVGWNESIGWNESTRILTVKEIIGCFIYFVELIYAFDLDKFEKVEEKLNPREDKLKALKSFDLIYVGDELVEFVGWSKPSTTENYIVYILQRRGEYAYRHTRTNDVRFIEDFWWVPIFKQGKAHELPELGKAHYNTKKECDDKWKSHPRFIGSVRVDNEAPTIR